MADGVYGFDPEIQDVDQDAEEAIALAASTGFTASPEVTADRVSVDGTTLALQRRDARPISSPTPPPRRPSPASAASAR